MADAVNLQEQMVTLIRAFGLHQPDQTPCGQPVSVSVAHSLMELGRSESLSQTDLGRLLRLEKSTVSRLVRQLEQRGWVQQEHDSTDRRAVQLRLTEAGRQAAAQIAAARSEKFARIAAEIPEAEQEGVWSALAVLVNAMNKSKRVTP